jgi:sodium/proline symporter
VSDPKLVAFAISFGIYSLLIVGVGLWAARRPHRSDEDYLLAGRSLGRWVAALSASASSESGWVTLGLVGWAFSTGVRAYWIIPGCLLGFLFNWFVVAGRLNERSRELGAITLPDFLSFHFRERIPVVRILSVVAIFVAMLLYVAAQFASAGKSFHAALPSIDYWAGVLIGAGIVLVYTVSGGFRAVSWTDFAQGILMVGTLVVFPLYLLGRSGGFSPLREDLRAIDPELLAFVPDLAPMAFLGFLLGAGALGINFGYPGQPHVLIRFMGLRSRREVFAGGIISAVWGALVYWGAVTVGLFARVMTAAGEEWAQQMALDPQYREAGLVLAAYHLLPGILSGLVLAAVLAAICSTADSQLMVAGSSLSNDLYVHVFRSGERRSHLALNRAAILALGVLAILLVIREEITVYEYVLTYGWAILGAAFGPQVILALFWRRASWAGCIAGMATGLMVALLWKLLMNNSLGDIEVYNLPLAFLAAFLVNVAVSLMVPGDGARGAPR